MPRCMTAFMTNSCRRNGLNAFSGRLLQKIILHAHLSIFPLEQAISVAHARYTRRMPDPRIARHRDQDIYPSLQLVGYSGFDLSLNDCFTQYDSRAPHLQRMTAFRQMCQTGISALG